MNPKKLILIVVAASLLTGCQFIGNTFKFKETTKGFIETILVEDYDNAISYFAMDHEIAKNTNLESFKNGLVTFRDQLVKNFGTKLDYKFMKSEKTLSTNKDESTPPNTTSVLIQISNDKEFGVLKILFDDTSLKILNIHILGIKEPIPTLTYFWLFGFFALLIPIFNIYIIIQIKKSSLKKKWLKYIAVIALNIPAITYSALNGLSFNLLSFQLLFGFSFGYMGYANSFWTIGIPLGGIFWFWKLKTNNKTESEIKLNTEYHDIKIESEI